MSIKSYKILIILLVLIISFILLYPIIVVDLNPNIHGTYMSGYDNKQNIISFDSSTNIYHRYIGGVLVESGTFKQSNIENLYFTENDQYSSHIILSKDSTFYLVDHTNNSVYNFEKSSAALTYFR